jgi:hypothetical protein
MFPISAQWPKSLPLGGAGFLPIFLPLIILEVRYILFNTMFLFKILVYGYQYLNCVICRNCMSFTRNKKILKFLKKI